MVLLKEVNKKIKCTKSLLLALQPTSQKYFCCPLLAFMISWPLFWLLQNCLQDNPWKQREISHTLPGRQSHSSPGCYLQWSAGWCTDTFDYHEINFGWSGNLGTHSAGLTCWCCCQAPGAARLCRWPLCCSALLLRWKRITGLWRESLWSAGFAKCLAVSLQKGNSA